MDETILSLNVLSFLFIVVSFLIYKFAFYKNKLTCNHYILNSYLYIVLSLLLISILVILIDKKQLFSLTIHPLVLFIFSIGFLIWTMVISPEKILYKHVLWFAWLFTFSYILFPIYKVSRLTGIFVQTLFVTFIMVFLLTLFAFINPDAISLSWGPILLVLLITGIVLRLTNIFLSKSYEKASQRSVILSYLFIVLFSFLILYDTKKLQVNAKKCVIPNYINESIGIFLDIINLFANLTRART